MRIIGGKYRGRRLVVPDGRTTRPTTDRMRERVFSILESRLDFDGIRVLDLFAGTGALGLEALSRGAQYVLFMEQAVAARAAIRQNIETLQAMGNTQLFRRDATRPGNIGTMQPFDLVFADPPYGKELGNRAAIQLLQGGWLQPYAVLMLEERKDSLPSMIEGYDTLDTRQSGDTAIGLYTPKGP